MSKSRFERDRTSAQERFSLQHLVLPIKLEQLKQPPGKTTSASSLETSYGEERAKIAQAKLEVEQA